MKMNYSFSKSMEQNEMLLLDKEKLYRKQGSRLSFAVMLRSNKKKMQSNGVNHKHWSADNKNRGQP